LLTGKFVEGMRFYCERWDGPVHAILQPGGTATGNLDDLVLARGDLPFTIDLLPLESQAVRERLRQAAIVMGAWHYLAPDLAAYCAGIGVPYVFICELNLRTRLQISRAEASSLLHRMRRSVWDWNQERLIRGALRVAAGVQCNGHPTYEAYRGVARDSLLYFDNRIGPEMLATQALVEARLRRNAARPLTLVYTGRLNLIKGADYLVPLAKSLRARGVDFELHICGDGELREAIRTGIASAGLAGRVHLRGVLDFHRELVPFVTEQADLFVCCHPQGDPACTYIETFACGVPIVGFANDAFAGLHRACHAGWLTPVGDVRAATEAIAAVANDRQRLQEPALAALKFASEHTFPMEFDRRVEHLERCARTR
jgi:glycosyltransferase involved in cell wall biosynthesis